VGSKMQGMKIITRKQNVKQVEEDTARKATFQSSLVLRLPEKCAHFFQARK